MTGNTRLNGSSSLEIAQSNQDLIINKGKRRKRTWIVGGIVTLIVVALLIAAVVLLTNGKERKSNDNQEAVALALEDILEGRVNPKSFNATWVSGNELLYVDSKGNLVLHNLEAKENALKVLLSHSDPVTAGAFEFKISADRQYLLLAYYFQKIYRHSFRARYRIINLNNGNKDELSINGTLDFSLVQWSPIGNALAIVIQNNIFYKDSVDGQPIQITKDDINIFNGIPDWVYEEEVFSSNKALWFSPDGKKLAFGRFDDRKTPIMVIPIFGEPGNLAFQYPKATVIRYPKVGTPNPLVSLHCVDLENTTSIKTLVPPSDLVNLEPLLTAVNWAKNDTVTAIWMNRVQNKASIVAYSIKEPFNTEIINNLSETDGWLELFTPPIFSKDGTEMVLILSQDQGGNLGSYRHVVLMETKQNSEITALTNGAFVVTEILGWDHDNDLIYFLSNVVNDSSVQHLSSVSPQTKEVKCLTCNRKSRSDQTNCLYNMADFSEDFSHYLHTCGGPSVPDLSIYSVKNSNQKLLNWEDNEELVRLSEEKAMPKIVKLSFEVAGGFQAQVSLKLPPNMDTSGKTKYPLLINVYAGPDSFQVVQKFNLDWGSYLSANKSIIYGAIDGRSSGLKGDKMLFASYRRLGSVEIEDQINVTKQIQEKLPYVDASRTAIWGWSYGGYAAGMALATDISGVFKCGISVAPVTDWTLYDSIYTERFMGLPTDTDNLKGYEAASLLPKYEGLKNKKYFLIHGTYDDNVHYQQSMFWAKVLEQNDIMFRQLTYPDEDHGLNSVRPHLYHSLEDFLNECFLLTSEQGT